MAVPARPSFLAVLPGVAFLLFCGALLAALPHPAGAMEAVDFPQAVARALRANPAVVAAGYDYAAAQQDVENRPRGVPPVPGLRAPVRPKDGVTPKSNRTVVQYLFRQVISSLFRRAMHIY